MGKEKRRYEREESVSLRRLPSFTPMSLLETGEGLELP